jgi:hypothetical protein
LVLVSRLEKECFEMRRALALLFSLVSGAAALTGCEGVSFDADGGPSGIQGGTPTQASDQLGLQVPPGPPIDYGPLTPGNTWTALYKDYFGAPKFVDGAYTGGRASCSGNVGACHGTPDATGAQISGGYVCPGETPDGGTGSEGGADTDADKSACYFGPSNDAGAGTFGIHTLVGDGGPFTMDLLYSALNSTNHKGGMPYGPPKYAYPTAYIFTDADIQRLAAWAEAGAPYN